MRTSKRAMPPNDPSPREILERLEAVLVERRETRPEGSYVVQLLDGGWPAIEAKILEEAREVVAAGRDESDAALTHEVADLLFHVMVGLVARGVAIESVYAELAGRFGIGGLEEKASRAMARADGASPGRDDADEGGAG